MNQAMQDQFEIAYSEDNDGLSVKLIKSKRLVDSYNDPKIARAWYWFKRSSDFTSTPASATETYKGVKP